MLLGNGQRGTVHALVDLLALLGLEGVETFPRVTHPVGTGHGVSLGSPSRGTIKNTPPRVAAGPASHALSAVPVSPPWY